MKTLYFGQPKRRRFESKTEYRARMLPSAEIILNVLSLPGTDEKVPPPSAALSPTFISWLLENIPHTGHEEAGAFWYWLKDVQDYLVEKIEDPILRGEVKAELFHRFAVIELKKGQSDNG